MRSADIQEDSVPLQPPMPWATTKAPEEAPSAANATYQPYLELVERINATYVYAYPPRNASAYANDSTMAAKMAVPRGAELISAELRITLYAAIFFVSLVGNGFVIATLAQNKRMRTVTNVLLLNLAISDLLLSVFCMPFTLVGNLLKEFIFGSVMCRLIPFFMAVSVSVSAWTLVTISLERYFAICQPLRSRRWQTLSHIYKMIAVIWIISSLWMLPIALVSQLQPFKGKYRCREVYPSLEGEKAFTLILDTILLFLPMMIMSLAYYLISRSLYKGMQQELENKNHEMTKMKDCPRPPSIKASKRMDDDASWGKRWRTSHRKERLQLHPLKRPHHPGTEEEQGGSASSSGSSPKEPAAVAPPSGGGGKPFKRVIRRTNLDKSLAAKRRVIRMLFVVVVEFFLCWTPLYVVNTAYLYSPQEVYKHLGSNGVALLHLLSYTSSCCNPITYCFMHKKFRQGFLTVFGCRRRRKRRRRSRSAAGRDASGNDGGGGSFYFSRQSTLRTEIPFGEKEEEAYRHTSRLLAASAAAQQSSM